MFFLDRLCAAIHLLEADEFEAVQNNRGVWTQIKVLDLFVEREEYLSNGLVVRFMDNCGILDTWDLFKDGNKYVVTGYLSV